MRAGAVRFPATPMITLTIDVHIDDSQLTEIGKQVPFAIYKAMNSAMLKAQARQRARMRIHLHHPPAELPQPLGQDHRVREEGQPRRRARDRTTRGP
jgi:hypothetical protein